MQFRIVGVHIHQAVVQGCTFTCMRQHTTTDSVVTVTWAASKGSTILKSDCRTLNEAKNLWRAAAAAAAATAAPAASAVSAAAVAQTAQ